MIPRSAALKIYTHFHRIRNYGGAGNYDSFTILAKTYHFTISRAIL